MKITVIAVGKIKEKYLTDAVAEYMKRLGRYCRLNIIEVADERTPDGASEAVEVGIREREGERILQKIPDGAYVIALAIDGNAPDSVEFARQMERWNVDGVSHMAFLIGGSLGLSSAVLKHADYRLSFSHMTFPHQLMRVILLEQIYRSFRIRNHEPYHK
ncbi:MAG: 23S rRNA (pseudouridine(1915)-N(3))-methyltransferase RlmH [Lachnospiraceae bacterium]|nr:23S rRNA (pseudouridine(1915)-N(3))-methyltransferase RlmH [Lachnospiraceae bacterium]